MNDWIEQELAEIAARGESRRLETWPALGPYLERAGQRILNLAGNDYLGLTAHRAVREAAAHAARDIGTGATASRLLAGTSTLHQQLEEKLAAWKGHPTALLFSSGYLAALGIIPLLAGRDDLIVADRLCHACLLDAARLSGATLVRFHHNDLDDAKRRLQKRAEHSRCLLVTESIFSMDGDRAPIRKLLDLAKEHDAYLLVDEAHALGVAGPRGAGFTADLPEAAQHLVTLGTLGKSLGAAGGFITAPVKLRELMINRARTFIFDTALPPPIVAAALAALNEIHAHPEWVDTLRIKSDRFRARLQHAGLDTLQSQSHIVPVRIGDNEKSVAVAAQLKTKHILVGAIRPPTVPPGTARLRLSISLAHEDHDLDTAADALIETISLTPGSTRAPRVPRGAPAAQFCPPGREGAANRTRGRVRSPIHDLSDKIKAHLFPGWAFPESALRPISDALGLDLVNESDADVWIAWSLGGLHALSRRDAAASRALVLISSTARFCADGTAWPGLPAANLRALQRQLARAPEAALRGFHRLCSEFAPDALIESRANESLTMSLEDGLRELAEIDVRSSLGAIDQPVLVLHGTRDRVIPVEAARAVAARIPNARLREHPDAGHDLPIAHCDWVVDRIGKFLQETADKRR